MSDDDDLGGGVDLTLLDKMVNSSAGVLPTADSADPSSVLKPLSGFLAHTAEWFGKIDDCAFVFATDPETDFGLLPGAKRHSNLIRPKGRTYSPSGRLHMIATGGNRAVSSPGGEDEAKLIKFLKANGLRGRPMARYLADRHAILWYPAGIGQPSLAVEIPVGNAGTADLPSIEKALAIFYDNRCRVPDRTVPFWHDATKRVPCRFAEKDIQKALWQSLQSVLHQCRVEREPRLVSSEVDFAIFGKHAGRQAALCVIEVKVLREKRWHVDAKLAKPCPVSVNRNNLIDGVEQAAFARNELIAPLAVMAAYDMRAKDDPAIMDVVAVTSKTNNVECRRYFLYNSKKAYRKANPAKAAEV